MQEEGFEVSLYLTLKIFRGDLLVVFTGFEPSFYRFSYPPVKFSSSFRSNTLIFALREDGTYPQEGSYEDLRKRVL